MDGQSRTPAAGDRYQHFKGGIYVIVGIAESQTADPDQHVVYRSENDGGSLWVRPLGEFCSTVETPDGDRVARFTLLGVQKAQHLDSFGRLTDVLRSEEARGIIEAEQRNRVQLRTQGVRRGLGYAGRRSHLYG